MSKIPQGEWNAIAARYESGESISKIARSYGCTPRRQFTIFLNATGNGRQQYRHADVNLSCRNAADAARSGECSGACHGNAGGEREGYG